MFVQFVCRTLFSLLYVYCGSFSEMPTIDYMSSLVWYYLLHNVVIRLSSVSSLRGEYKVGGF